MKNKWAREQHSTFVRLYFCYTRMKVFLNGVAELVAVRLHFVLKCANLFSLKAGESNNVIFMFLFI